ncbi:hypothetical protein ACFP81_15085 [Deinococcus lacus]|uniref:Uncharacterized protein n=1 Tax=Deinococcus lacus TaxID=392561 RepID=A0ABW1YJS9_9DEIO
MQARVQAEQLREQQVEAEQAERLHQQLSLPPEEQWKAVEGMLRMMLGKRFSKEEMQALKEACRSGKYSAAELAHQATRAAALLELEDFVTSLRQKLKP